LEVEERNKLALAAVQLDSQGRWEGLFLADLLVVRRWEDLQEEC